MKRAPVGRCRGRFKTARWPTFDPGEETRWPQQHTLGSVQGRGPPCAAFARAEGRPLDAERVAFEAAKRLHPKD
jgi:hypothetical protein